MKRLAAALCAAVLALSLSGCSGGTSERVPDRPAVQSGERQFTAPADGDLIAIFDTSLGEVRAVLYPDAAPMAVQNFVGLARNGYYDGTIIWRSEYAFAVQGGDATGTGTGGSTIWSNHAYPLEADASLKHYAGALCAAFASGGEEEGGTEPRPRAPGRDPACCGGGRGAGGLRATRRRLGRWEHRQPRRPRDSLRRQKGGE